MTIVTNTIFLFFFNFIYFWLSWVFIAVCGLLIAVASLVSEHGLQSAQASVVAARVLSSCGTWALECRGFSSCGTWAQQLQCVGSIVVAHGPQSAQGLQQLQHMGPRAQGLQQLWHVGSVVVVCRLSSYGTWALEHRNFSSCGTRALGHAGFSSCGAWAQQLWLEGSRAQAQQLRHMGLVAPWRVGSSWTGDRTRVPWIGRQVLNHCATREVPFYLL